MPEWNVREAGSAKADSREADIRESDAPQPDAPAADTLAADAREETPLSRERRTGLLACAEPAELMDLADKCLTGGPDPVVVVPPEIGAITAQVREPIVGQRFLLGDVLVCRAEVEWSGHRGWAMRTDEDRPAVLAAAILDAAAQADPSHAVRVDALCTQVAERIREGDALEWAELAPTVVHFEELR